jgi:hypothetical protein
LAVFSQVTILFVLIRWIQTSQDSVGAGRWLQVIPGQFESHSSRTLPM